MHLRSVLGTGLRLEIGLQLEAIAK
jgi:hypothetical protein